MEAGNEAGLMDVGKHDKPPPTCIDVECSLEQLYKIQAELGVEADIRAAAIFGLANSAIGSSPDAFPS